MAGHFVFTPDDTPHYPQLHFWGSRNWTTDDYLEAPDLGEVRGVRQRYHSGLTPNPYPEGPGIGDPLTGEGPFVFDEYSQGFPLDCYVNLGSGVRLLPFVPDIDSKFGQLPLAKVIDKLYSDDVAAGVMLAGFMGPGTVVATVPNSSSVIPGTVIGVNGDDCVCCIAGTSNITQAATYSVFSLTGPVDVGQYSTNLLWYAAAQLIQDRIDAAGGNPLGRITLAGHSYGGAVAHVIAADYVRWNPARVVNCCTFGACKCGDERMQALLRRARVVRLANDGDPVPSLPPSYVQALPYLIGLPAVLVTNWEQLTQPTGQRVLFANGTILETEASTLDVQYLAYVVACVVGSIPMVLPFPHSIGEYVNRLQM